MTLPDNLNIYAPGLTLLETFSDGGDFFPSMEWSPDGRTLALGSGEGATFATLDTKTFVLSRHFVGYRAGVYDVAWSPDGNEVACICMDGTVLRYSLTENEVVHIYTEWPGSGTSITWSPNGRFLAVATESDIELWNVETGESIPLSAKSNVRPIFFQDSSRLLCVTTTPLTIWDVLSRRKIREFHNVILENSYIKGHSGSVRALALSSDERLIATGGYDTYVTIWDNESGLPIRELTEAQAKVRSLTFSPDSAFLVGTSADNVLRVWSAKRDWRQVVQLPDLKGGWAGGIKFHPSENVFVTGAQGGRVIHFWKYDPYAWR